MDKEKIEELKNRRKKLQEEVRLKEIRGRVKSQIAHLEKLGQAFTVYYEFENINWIYENVQLRTRDGYRGVHGDFQIDVDDSILQDNFRLGEEEIDSNKFRNHFTSLIPDDKSLVVCYEGGDPELEISVKAFLDSPSTYFSRPETWIITTDKTWIIEYIWDQGVIRFIQLQESTPSLIKKIIIEYE